MGTRPEAIKLAPVADALAERGITPWLIFTGQHPDLDPADHALDRYPLVRLRCAGQDDPHVHVGMVSKAAADVLGARLPDLLMVQGDTSTALGGALAARVAEVPLAHVEAGLRTHDLRRPWPEEEFRTAIDRQAELLLAPTALSAANLRRERVRGRIHVTGNSGIDAVLRAQCGLQLPARGENGRRVLVTCHRRENWGEGISGVAAALTTIAGKRLARVDVILHPNPALSTRVRELLGGHEGITLRGHVGHSATIAAMLGCDLVLSDSGGLQEEAAALGVPLLVLRDRTERPEAIACGNVELVGTDHERIVEAVRRRLKGSTAAAALPFGDGRASERIAKIVEEWLEERREGALALAVPSARSAPGAPVRFHQP